MPALRRISRVGLTSAWSWSSTPVRHSSSISISRLSITVATFRERSWTLSLAWTYRAWGAEEGWGCFEWEEMKLLQDQRRDTARSGQKKHKQQQEFLTQHAYISRILQPTQTYNRLHNTRYLTHISYFCLNKYTLMYVLASSLES